MRQQREIPLAQNPLAFPSSGLRWIGAAFCQLAGGDTEQQRPGPPAQAELHAGNGVGGMVPTGGVSDGGVRPTQRVRIGMGLKIGGTDRQYSNTN